MATIKEITKAYITAKNAGAKKITLLYCVSKYPSTASDFNLNNIKILKKKFKCKIGFSDHSLDNRIAILAISAGAEVVEKHIALEGQKKGFDIKFSLKGKEIKKFREDIDVAWNLRGKDYFFRNSSEKVSKMFKRSIYPIKTIKKGEKFTTENISIIRPGFSLDPSYYYNLLNKRAKKNFEPGQRILLKNI